MYQINIKTANLNQAIVNIINNSDLPPCVVGLVLDKLRGEVSNLEARAILQERQAAESQEEATE